MNSKTIEADGYNIHIVKTDKFKSVEMHLVLTCESKEDNYLIGALNNLLSMTSKYYKTKRDRRLKSEELYGTDFDFDLDVYGRTCLIDIASFFINPKLVDEDFTEEAIKYPFDIFGNPVFDDKYLNDIKQIMIKTYKRVYEHPFNEAFKNGLKLFLNDPRDRYDFIVDEDIVNTITMEQIEKKYNEIINNSNVDVFIVGDVDDNYIEYIKKYNIYKSSNIELVKRINNKQLDKIKIKEESKKGSNQSQLFAFYNVPVENEYDRLALGLYNCILYSPGGGRLYDIIREKHHLCYAVELLPNLFLNCSIITAGIAESNIELTYKLIDEIIDNMKEITDKEFEEAKRLVKNELKMRYTSLSNVYYSAVREKIFDNMPLDEQIKTVDKITKEDLYKFNNKMKLDTKYVLKGE